MDAVAILQTVLSAVQSGSLGNLNASEVVAATNATIAAATVSGGGGGFSPAQIPQMLSMLLSFSAIRDWLKLLLLGAFVEACRRLLTRGYTYMVDYFWLTATFDGNDDCVDWLMFWLSKHPIFRTARTLDVSTRTFGRSSPSVDEEDDDAGRKISFLPSLATSYSLWYKRRYLTIMRDQVQDGPWNGMKQTLQIRVFSRRHDILRELLTEAKELYNQASENMISIYVSDPSDYWKRVSTQHKRPMNSIILDPGMIDLVLDDAKDFLQSKTWYAERGIPHRRGYLLYGAPGSGKTSMIHSIAGELNLDVYILSLTRLGLDDTALSSTISDLPQRCIVLIEDIDAAFTHSLKRDLADPEKQLGEDGKPVPPGSKNTSEASVGRVTLSGLLNALDGIAAQEGRILFATTNDYKSLDPALCRPGRLDLHVEFKLSSKYQARELFRRFYLPSGDDAEKDAEKDKEAETEKSAEDKLDEKSDSGYGPSRSDSFEETPLLSATDVPLPSSSASSWSSSSSAASVADSEADEPVCVGQAHTMRAPKLSRKKVAELADRFAAAIPSRAFSMATLQGYLMTYKVRPYDAVKDAPAWVESKRMGTGGAAQVSATDTASAAAPSSSEDSVAKEEPATVAVPAEEPESAPASTT